MKKKLILGMALGLAVVAAPVAQAMTLEDRVGELEASQSLNIWNFSGSLVTRYDNIATKQDTAVNPASNINAITSSQLKGLGNTMFDAWCTATAASTCALVVGGVAPAAITGAYNRPVLDSKVNYIRLISQLNADANVSPYIKFYSRLTATKFFNRYAGQGGSPTLTQDVSSSDNYAGSQVVFEKAYTDITVPGTNLIVSAGRIPTSDGGPAHFWDGRARLGTYPMLSYNVSLDGMALTYKLDSLMPTDNKLAARVIYTPFNNTNSGNGVNRNDWLQLPTKGVGDTFNNINDLVAVQLDYSVRNTMFADNINFIAQYLKSGQFNLNSGSDPRSTSIPNPSDITLAFEWTTLMLEMNRIAGSNFDLSAQYLMSKLNSKGTLYTFVPGSYVTSASAPAAAGYYPSFYTPLGGFGCSNANGTGCEGSFDGSILVVDLRYKLGGTYLGAELQQGSSSQFFFDGASEQLSGFYNTPGTGTHVYVTHQFTQNLSSRIGFMQQNYKWTGLIYGGVPDTETDKKVQTTYANLRLDF